MTEKDKKLIEKAWSVPYVEWYKIKEEEADTEEGREKLHTIMMVKYHQEEGRDV